MVADSDSASTGTDSESDGTADYDSDSESELWKHYDFPQLTPEEDTQLTIALQGGTPLSTTSTESSSTIEHHEATDHSSRMRSGFQGPNVQISSESRPPYGPPPYMSEFGEGSGSQPMNHIFFINNNSMIPISSTDRPFYVVVDGVYHVVRQI